VIAIAASVAVVLITAPAMPRSYPDTVCIRATGVPEGAAVTVTSSTGARAECRTDKDEKECLCTAGIADDSSGPLVVEIAAAGYKRYSRNVPPAAPAPRRVVDLQAVALVRGVTPAVRSAIQSFADDGVPVYRLVLENPMPKAILVREIRIEANRGGFVPRFCHHPEVHEYDVLPGLAAVQRSAAHTDVAGAFREPSSGGAYTTGMAGKIEREKCSGHDRLQLTLSTALELPPNAFTRVDVRLPKRFELRAGRVEVMDRSLGFSAPSQTVSGFYDFKFTFVPAEASEPFIEGRVGTAPEP
jgi:hypothetical protein